MPPPSPPSRLSDVWSDCKPKLALFVFLRVSQFKENSHIWNRCAKCLFCQFHCILWVGPRQTGGPGVIIFSQITIKIKSKHLSGYPPLIISNMRTTNHLPDKNTHKKSFSFFVAPKFLDEKCFVIFLGRHLYLSQKVVLTLLAYF